MQTVSWAGSTYNIPNQRGDTPWSGLSDFAIAVAAKGINTGGGNFTLLADLNFGATYGLLSAYFSSRTANPASAGLFRLAKTDVVSWRNNANDGDINLSKNTSNELLWNGSRIILAGGGLIVNADISASAAIAFSKMAALTASKALVSDSSGIVVTSTTTAAEIGYVGGVTSAIQTQLNAKAADSDVVKLTGDQTIAGNKTFSDPIIQNDTSNQLVLGVTRTVTINAPTPASLSRIVTIPDLSAAYSVVGTEGTQTINGAKTFTDPITQDDTTNQIVLGTTRTITISAPTPATSSRVVTIPDPGTAANFVLSEATATINGVKTFAGQLIGKGTATNDSAASGYIGEYIESTTTSNLNAATSDQYDDLVSVSLTAGDWEVTGLLVWASNTATWTEVYAGISTTSGNSATGLSSGVSLSLMVFASSSTTPLNVTLTVPTLRVLLSATTTVYLKRKAVYSANTPRTIGGRLSARRMR